MGTSSPRMIRPTWPHPAATCHTRPPGIRPPSITRSVLPTDPTRPARPAAARPLLCRTWHPIQLHRSMPPGSPVQSPPTDNRPASSHGYHPPLSTSPHTTWLPSDRHTHDPRDQPPPVRPPPDSSHPGPLDRSRPIGSHRTHVHGSHGPSPHQSDIRPSDICPADIRSHAWGHPRDIPPGIVRPRPTCGVRVRSPAMIYLPASFAVASRSPPELPVRPPSATGS